MTRHEQHNKKVDQMESKNMYAIWKYIYIHKGIPTHGETVAAVAREIGYPMFEFNSEIYATPPEGTLWDALQLPLELKGDVDALWKYIFSHTDKPEHGETVAAVARKIRYPMFEFDCEIYATPPEGIPWDELPLPLELETGLRIKITEYR